MNATLKELQSLGLDVKVLDEEGNEVELAENIDYGDTDIRSILESDSKNYSQNESFGDYGYQEQEFKDGELVAVDDEGDSYTDDMDDDYSDISDEDLSDEE